MRLATCAYWCTYISSVQNTGDSEEFHWKTALSPPYFYAHPQRIASGIWSVFHDGFAVGVAPNMVYSLIICERGNPVLVAWSQQKRDELTITIIARQCIPLDSRNFLLWYRPCLLQGWPATQRLLFVHAPTTGWLAAGNQWHAQGGRYLIMTRWQGITPFWLASMYEDLDTWWNWIFNISSTQGNDLEIERLLLICKNGEI